MAPIHESDIAEERWSREAWRYLEFWEKIEKQVLKRKRFWIAATAILFLAFSSIPVVSDRAPKWNTLDMARALALELNTVKRLAATHGSAFRLAFTGGENLAYRIEKLKNCQDPASTLYSEGALLKTGASGMTLLDTATGENLGVHELVTSFCYDPLLGSEDREWDLSAFAIIPVNDLTEHRLDRMSLVLMRGQTGEISFN